MKYLVILFCIWCIIGVSDRSTEAEINSLRKANGPKEHNFRGVEKDDKPSILYVDGVEDNNLQYQNTSKYDKLIRGVMSTSRQLLYFLRRLLWFLLGVEPIPPSNSLGFKPTFIPRLRLRVICTAAIFALLSQWNAIKGKCGSDDSTLETPCDISELDIQGKDICTPSSGDTYSDSNHGLYDHLSEFSTINNHNEARSEAYSNSPSDVILQEHAFKNGNYELPNPDAQRLYYLDEHQLIAEEYPSPPSTAPHKPEPKVSEVKPPKPHTKKDCKRWGYVLQYCATMFDAYSMQCGFPLSHWVALEQIRRPTTPLALTFHHSRHSTHIIHVAIEYRHRFILMAGSTQLYASTCKNRTDEYNRHVANTHNHVIDTHKHDADFYNHVTDKHNHVTCGRNHVVAENNHLADIHNHDVKSFDVSCGEDSSLTKDFMASLSSQDITSRHRLVTASAVNTLSLVVTFILRSMVRQAANIHCNVV